MWNVLEMGVDPHPAAVPAAGSHVSLAPCLCVPPPPGPSVSWRTWSLENRPGAPGTTLGQAQRSRQTWKFAHPAWPLARGGLVAVMKA